MIQLVVTTNKVGTYGSAVWSGFRLSLESNSPLFQFVTC